MLNDVRNSSVLLQRATQLTLQAYILKPNGILWIRDSVILSPLAPSLLLFHVCLQKDLIGQSLTPCILKTTSRSSCLQRLKSNPQYLQDWNAELMSKIIAVNIYASISAEKYILVAAFSTHFQFCYFCIYCNPPSLFLPCTYMLVLYVLYCCRIVP